MSLFYFAKDIIPYHCLRCCIFLKDSHVTTDDEVKILLSCAFIIVEIFLNYFMSFLPDYYLRYYTDSEYAQGSVRLASIVDFAFLSLGFLLCQVRKNVSQLWQYYDDFRVFYILGLGFSFLGLIFNPFNRVEMFFIPLTIVYVVNVFKYLSPLKKYGLAILYSLLAVYLIVALVVSRFFRKFISSASKYRHQMYGFSSSAGCSISILNRCSMSI